MKAPYYILLSMRPHQWTKNLVVFAALIFSQSFQQQALVLQSLQAFAIFCVLSGMIYLINDIVDIEKDKLHERKRHRPLPAGNLSVPAAVGGVLVGTAAALGWAYLLGPAFVLVACGFLLLNIVYSLALKKVVLLDALSISISFILRAIGGVEALVPLDAAIEISPWLLICTLFLSLFLAFCKRRHELLTMDEAGNHRESLREYSSALLDQLVGITASGSVLAYSIYTIWPNTVAKFGSSNLVYTVPLVLAGVMRYLYLVYNKEKGGSPADLLLHERFLLGVVVAWVVLVIAIITFF